MNTHSPSLSPAQLSPDTRPSSACSGNYLFRRLLIARLFMPFIMIVAITCFSTQAIAQPRHNHQKRSAQTSDPKTGQTSHVNSDSQNLWITVFVHGIMSVKPHLTTNNFIRFMQDKIENTFYEKTVLIMRDDPFFFQNQAMGPRGLHYIDSHALTNLSNSRNYSNNTHTTHQQATEQSFEQNSTRGSAAMAYLFDQMQQYAQTGQYNNRYYTFGWTGLLSPRQRYEDGRGLFKALEDEVQKLKNQGLNPKVRVIGYSHGGNVCLNLGAVHQKDFPDSKLTIDELVLIGTPIQHDTDYLINDPIFKKVYNLYSMSDRVQKLDFFSTDRFFSGRRFIHRPGFKIPQKLKQIQLKVTRNRVNKNKVNKERELANSLHVLDLDARGIKTGKSPLLRNASPGHAELWFFGWTPQHYRADYPLYPLPTIAMLPFITKNSADTYVPHRLIVDIRPEHNTILFKDRKKDIVYKTVPFIEKSAFATLEKNILSFAPGYYTKEDYEKHTQYAIDQSITKYKHLYAPKGKKHRARTCKISRKKAPKN